MTPAIGLLLLGGILFEAARTNRSIIDTMLGREHGPEPDYNPPAYRPPSTDNSPPGDSAKDKVPSSASIGKRALLGVVATHARALGLRVGEHPDFGGVDPVHVQGSYHYKGRAIDVSGDTNRLSRFANQMDRLYGPRLTELFWNGPRPANRKNGARRGAGFVSGHTNHVHVAV